MLTRTLLLCCLALLTPALFAYEHDNAPEEVRRIHVIADAIDSARIKADAEALTARAASQSIAWFQQRAGALAEQCTANISVHSLDAQAGAYAFQKGILDPNRVLIVAVDTSADGSASGLAGLVEALRVVCQTRFPGSLVYAAVNGDNGGATALLNARQTNAWRAMGVITVADIASQQGVNGLLNNHEVSIHSEGVASARQVALDGVYSVADSPSRNYARRIARLADQYLPRLTPVLVHRRATSTHAAGSLTHRLNQADVPAFTLATGHTPAAASSQDYGYAARITRLMAISLAAHGGSPPFPVDVTLSETYPLQLSWQVRGAQLEHANLRGWRVYWRETHSPHWQFSRYLTEDARSITLEGLDPSRVYVGVAAVANDGLESPVVAPGPTQRFDLP